MHMYEKLIARRAHRLREHGRGPQHALRGPLVPAHHPAGRERRGRGALHDARQRRHRRRGDPRGARARLSRSTARRCTSTALHAATTTSARTARSTTPTRRSRPRRTRRRCGTARWTASISTVATDGICTPLVHQDPGQAHRRHDRRQRRRRAARLGDVHRDGGEARLLAGAVRRPDLGQRRPHHGALSAQGRDRRGQRRRYRASSIPASAARCAWKTCTRPTTARGKARESARWPSLPCCAARWWSTTAVARRPQGRPAPPAQDLAGDSEKDVFMKVARFHKFGGPEVLVHEEAPKPAPKPGEALVRVRAVGINHVDLDHRAGTSRIPLTFPSYSDAVRRRSRRRSRAVQGGRPRCWSPVAFLAEGASCASPGATTCASRKATSASTSRAATPSTSPHPPAVSFRSRTPSPTTPPQPVRSSSRPPGTC